MLNKILFAGLLSLALAACGGTEGSNGAEGVGGVEELDGPTAETQDELGTCVAPVNGHADHIASTRTGSHWCWACSYVTIQINNTTTGAPVLSYWAGLDTVTQQYFPGFCLPSGGCRPGFWQRVGIHGNFYAYAAVTLQGYVTFDHPVTHNLITVTPTQCTATTPNVTEIRGLGNDNVLYTIRLENTWFS